MFKIGLGFVGPFMVSVVNNNIKKFLTSVFRLETAKVSVANVPKALLCLGRRLPLCVLMGMITFNITFKLA